MATVNFAKLKNTENTIRNTVFGFIRQCQLLFDKDISYYNIPDLIAYICLSYYRNQYVFMNGVNILSRDWKKCDEIEYDSDGEGKHKPGAHIHKGKIITVKNRGVGLDKIIIKCDDGAYVAFRLNEVKLKLIDNGTPIISYQQAHTEISIDTTTGALIQWSTNEWW